MQNNEKASELIFTYSWMYNDLVSYSGHYFSQRKTLRTFRRPPYLL